MTVAICPGSYDPITMGHIDIIERASNLFDRIIVAVAIQPRKETLFSIEDRVKFILNYFKKNDCIIVESFDTLLVKFAKKYKAKIIIKGLRAVTDFETEFQMAQLNHELNPSLETIFMMASPKYAYLSSSAIKEIAQYGGNVKDLVPQEIEKELMAKFV